jgi:hypothetical protein
MNLKSKPLAAVLILAAAFSGQVYAVTPSVTPLLIIDDSDPSAVTITATDYNPFRSDTSHEFVDGVDLTNFFAPNLTPKFTQFFDTGDGDLSTSLDQFPSFLQGELDEFTGDSQDLNLFAETLDTENFNVNDPAFIGSSAFDLSSMSAYLLPAGTIGAIYAGYSGDLPLPTVTSDSLFSPDAQALSGYLMYLGDYEIVPEPGQWTLLLLGAAGLFSFQRFRSSRASS